MGSSSSIWEGAATNLPFYLGWDGYLFIFLFGMGFVFIGFSIWKGWPPIYLSIWDWICIYLFFCLEGMATNLPFYLKGMATNLFFYLGRDWHLPIFLFGRDGHQSTFLFGR